MERFKKLEALGDGSFGLVFKAEDVQTGEIVAVKKLKQKYTLWED
jgi:protein kinase